MAHHSADVNELLHASGETTVERATQKAQEQIDCVFNVTLNIAVTGESGAGKSTFINALRGLHDDDDEGAAKTGLVETTKVPTPYLHPQMPNVTFWDLPGIGTLNCKANKYCDNMKFDTYDFFIIISAGRCKENDIVVAKEIIKQKKKFYFVRSKMDQDIDNNDINKEEKLSTIRTYCRENLRDMGDPKIFLISSRFINDYDFQDLVDTIMSELPEHKQYALLQSLPVSSMAILEKKVKMYKRAAWAAAALSGAIAIVPVPGLSTVCDKAILTAYFTRCYYALGLNDKSLEKSDRVNNPSPKSLGKSELVEELVSKAALRLGLSGTAEIMCSLVPVVGSAAAAGISFDVTHQILIAGVDEIAKKAREVLRESGLK